MVKTTPKNKAIKNEDRVQVHISPWWSTRPDQCLVTWKWYSFVYMFGSHRIFGEWAECVTSNTPCFFLWAVLKRKGSNEDPSVSVQETSNLQRIVRSELWNKNPPNILDVPQYIFYRSKPDSTCGSVSGMVETIEKALISYTNCRQYRQFMLCRNLVDAHTMLYPRTIGRSCAHPATQLKVDLMLENWHEFRFLSFGCRFSAMNVPCILLTSCRYHFNIPCRMKQKENKCCGWSSAAP